MMRFVVVILLAIGLIRPIATVPAKSKFVIAPTPTPTIMPAPSPEPLVGFCERVPILMYHHTETSDEVKVDGHSNLNVSAEWFAKQMAYLQQRGYKTLTITDVVSSLLNKSQLGSKVIVLTADDGYDDIFQNAYPVLQKYGLHLDLEIIAGLVGNPGYLTWDQLREMQNSGLVHIYNHTWSHPWLPTQTADKITYEIRTAQMLLNQNLGVTAKIITYPYGAANNSVINIARAQGFTAGISTKPGQTQCDSFVMTLHRTRVGNAPLSYYGI